MKVNSVEVSKKAEIFKKVDFLFQFCANYFWDNVDQPGVAQLLIQYYIDLMGHSYQLAEDGLLEGVNEDLILSICNSVNFLTRFSTF